MFAGGLPRTTSLTRSDATDLESRQVTLDVVRAVIGQLLARDAVASPAGKSALDRTRASDRRHRRGCWALLTSSRRLLLLQPRRQFRMQSLRSSKFQWRALQCLGDWGRKQRESSERRKLPPGECGAAAGWYTWSIERSTSWMMSCTFLPCARIQSDCVSAGNNLQRSMVSPHTSRPTNQTTPNLSHTTS